MFHLVWNHDDQQGFIVRIDSYIEARCLEENKNSVQNWEKSRKTLNEKIHWHFYL